MWEEAWLLTEALVVELATHARRSGSRFVVAVVPARPTVNVERWRVLEMFYAELKRGTWDLDYPRRRTIDFLIRSGIEYVDVSERLGAFLAETGRDGYLQADVHLSPEGHRVVADALTEFVIPVEARSQ